VSLYNHELPQSALKGKTPVQTMKEWYLSNPELFVKRPYNWVGLDSLLHAKAVGAILSAAARRN